MTTDHTAPAVWPTAEQAYALAPSIISEIGWTVRQAIRKQLGQAMPREFWLRKAALLDRVALADSDSPDTTDLATAAGTELMMLDGRPPGPDPRAYVRQQYARWAHAHAGTTNPEGRAA
ncbi:hypothetical protein [Streptomyces sp. NPDC003077]|uniref:hypothetical protein n=1 Tax=Streptomyces sp. NPDC003077 TaxID=3154443 RepID=UPI0033B70EE3